MSKHSWRDGQDQQHVPGLLNLFQHPLVGLVSALAAHLERYLFSEKNALLVSNVTFTSIGETQKMMWWNHIFVTVIFVIQVVFYIVNKWHWTDNNTTMHAENILSLQIISKHLKIVLSMGPKVLVHNRTCVFSQVSFRTGVIFFSISPHFWGPHKICIVSEGPCPQCIKMKVLNRKAWT